MKPRLFRVALLAACFAASFTFGVVCQTPRRAGAAKTLAAVKAAGKFPGANLRPVCAGFDGT